MSFRADLALLGLAVVGVLAELACVLTGHQPPGLFQEVTLAGLAGGAGIALPGARTTPDPSTPDPTAPAPAPVRIVEPVSMLAPSGPASVPGQQFGRP